MPTRARDCVSLSLIAGENDGYGPGLPSPPGDTRVFESAVVLSAAGVGGATVAMTTGFAVASGATIGLDLIPGPEMDGTNGSLQHAILHGYLTID